MNREANDTGGGGTAANAEPERAVWEPGDSWEPEAYASPWEAVVAYGRAGLSFIPISRDGSKRPDGRLLPREPDPITGKVKSTWKPFEQRLPTEEESQQWFDRDEPPGIAIICGAVSGNLEVVDFDKEAETIFSAWFKMVEAQAPGLFSRLNVVRTPRPGYHVRYRCKDIQIPGHDDLATDPSRPRDDRTLIETRAEGNYALAPGSPGACHDTGKEYLHVAGPPLTKLAEITAAERDVLLNCARTFDRRPKSETPKAERIDSPFKKRATTNHATNHHADDLKPGDDFDKRGDWKKILEPHGWTLVATIGAELRWRRPDKKGDGWSATTGHCERDDGDDLLHVFSSNADPFEADHTYSKFAAYALLKHNGDFSAAAKDLYKQGFGTRLASNSESSKSGTEGKSQIATPATMTPQPAKDIILAHWKDEWQPRFRRLQMIYSETRNCEVRRSDVCFGADSKLLAALATATDAPRDDLLNVKLRQLPRLFKDYAPTAWKDLINSLPDEDQGAEVIESACDEFTAQIAVVLNKIVPMGRTYKGERNKAETEIEQRRLIDWCQIWARPGPWESIRSYRLWTRLDATNPDRPVLKVAFHHDLFGQVGAGNLAKLPKKKLPHMCRRYDIGSASDECRPGGTRAIQLTHEFIQSLLAKPELPNCRNENAPAHTRGENENESATQGDNHCDTRT